MAKDYQILRETLKKVIDESGLDIGGKYFVLKDFFRDIEVAYYSKINSEFMSEAEGVKQDAEGVQRECVGELPQREHSAE